MDTVGKLKKVHNDKGFALVYLALIIVVLVAIVGLAVDVGYMYVTKGQLQNAADSAALAGAAQLKAVNKNVAVLDNHSSARRKAWRFACKNSAASKDVMLVSSADNCESPPADLNNSNASTGDIVLGHYDSTTGFVPANGTDTINAVKVLARRTADSPGGAVDTFFARILGVVGYDWRQMSAGADAVAAMLTRSTGLLAMCTEFCTAPWTGERVMVTGNSWDTSETKKPGNAEVYAWTSLTTHQTAPGFNLNDLICGNSPNEYTCGQPIYTTKGSDTTTVDYLEGSMYDPSFDSGNKEIVDGEVTGWTITVPITNDCPPSTQGSAWDPKSTWGYAKIHIKLICASGAGKSCGGGKSSYSAPKKSCDDYKKLKDVYFQNSFVVIDRFECVSCADSNAMEGLKPALVK